MPLRCVQRPNRTFERRFNAKAVGRIYCLALEAGESQAEIEAEIDKCDRIRRDGKVEVEDAQVQVAEATAESESDFQATAEAIRDAMVVALAVLLALRALPFILTTVPRLAIAALPLALRQALLGGARQLPAMTSQLKGFAEVVRLRLGSAANDPKWQEFFRRVSGL